MSFLEHELESSNAPLLVNWWCRSRWILVFRCSGTYWLPSSVVQKVCLHPVEKTCSLGPASIEWEMEESQKWVEKSDLWLILVVVSYNQHVLWYHLVVIRPQTVKSLCISVIPGSVMLTHTILEGFITEFQSHTYYIKYLKIEYLLQ